MNRSRSVAIGETRVCPYCKATILRSENACPACHHHLRYNAAKPDDSPSNGFSPLRVEGVVRNPGYGKPWEYSVVLEIRDDHGAVISSRVMSVGALFPSESRVFTLRVNVSAPDAANAKPEPLF